MERSEANVRVAQKGGPEGILPSKEAKKGGAVLIELLPQSAGLYACTYKLEQLINATSCIQA